jgi:nucleoside permease NupC
LYSLFFKEANLKSPRWLNIAIAVAVVIALGYFLFGTEAGKKVRNFIVNAIKGGLGAIKSAIKYVLGKSNAPKEIKDETESFLDEAAS